MDFRVHPGSLAAGAGVGFCAGVAVCLFVGQRKFRHKLDSEVASVKAYYNHRAKADVADVESRYAFIAVGEATVGTAGGDAGTTKTIVGHAEEVQHDADNPKGRHAGRTRYNTRPSDRSPVPIETGDEENIVYGGGEGLGPTPDDDPTKPYIIPALSFFEDHNDDFQKLSITYYAADGVLADDKDAPIRNVHETVGVRVPEDFGKQSDDPNIVYVRNARLEIDFEITLDQRSFSEVVLGYGNPVKAKKKVRSD